MRWRAASGRLSLRVRRREERRHRPHAAQVVAHAEVLVVGMLVVVRIDDGDDDEWRLQGPDDLVRREEAAHHANSDERRGLGAPRRSADRGGRPAADGGIDGLQCRLRRGARLERREPRPARPLLVGGLLVDEVITLRLNVLPQEVEDVRGVGFDGRAQVQFGDRQASAAAR